MSMYLPIKLHSPNTQQHWSQKHRFHKQLRLILQAQWDYSIKPPAVITITRIAPRPYDFDNLVAACKGLRDIIADLIIPGLLPGQADGDKRLKFRYRQKKGNPKEYAIEIEVKYGK